MQEHIYEVLKRLVNMRNLKNIDQPELSGIILDYSVGISSRRGLDKVSCHDAKR
jgi:hypothetical protein